MRIQLAHVYLVKIFITHNIDYRNVILSYNPGYNNSK